MASPVPWADAVSRINAAIVTGQPLAGLTVEYPNEGFTRPEPPAPFLSVEMAGDGMGAIEMSGVGAWTERGQLFVHILAPVGTGTTAVRAIAKAVSNLFRNVSASANALLYERQSIGMGELEEDDGPWWVMTVVIEWKYTDRPA